LLDAVVARLKNIPKMKLDRLSQMGDFARLVVACEEVLLWPSGAFLKRHAGNKSETIEPAIKAGVVVATAVKELVEKQVNCNSIELLPNFHQLLLLLKNSLLGDNA